MNDLKRLGRQVRPMLSAPVFRIVLLIVVVVVLGGTLVPGTFLTEKNFYSICKQLPEYGILALAVFICMMSGGIDLSAVFVANFSAILVGKILLSQAGNVNAVVIIGAIMAALVTGALCGLVNGFLVGRLKVPAMLATLGTGELFLGISTIITSGKALSGIPSEYTQLARLKVLGFPINFIVFLVCGVIMGILISKTSFGLRVQLIGTNSKAARFSGVNCPRDLLLVYMISGIFAAVSGVISIMRLSSAKPDYGTSYTMFSILICVFSGTDPNGGKGSVMGVVLATLVLQMVATLMNMFTTISTFYRDIVWGALLIIMLIVNYLLDSRRVSTR